VTTLEAARAGRLKAQLVDRVRGLAWSLDEPVLERRRFRVAAGRRARDRGLIEGGGDGLVTMTDVAVWEQAGPRTSLAGLLTALGTRTGVSAEFAAVADADMLEPAMVTDAPAEAAAPPTPELFGAVEAAVGADGVRRFRLRTPESMASPLL
jgi:hypothetical protein